MGIYQTIRDAYHQRKEERTRRENYQLKRKAIKHGMMRTGGGIRNEYELNVALHLANTRIPINGGPNRQEESLFNAFQYVEGSLQGEERGKYEDAVLRRAKRLKARLMDRYSQEREVLHEAAIDYNQRREKGLRVGRHPAASYSSEVDVWKQDANKIQKDIIDKLERGSGSGLAGKVSMIIAIIGFIIGIFFLSNSFTGNVIGMTTSAQNWIPVACFLLSLAGIFLYLKKRG